MEFSEDFSAVSVIPDGVIATRMQPGGNDSGGKKAGLKCGAGAPGAGGMPTVGGSRMEGLVN